MFTIHNGDNGKDDALSCMQCSKYSGDAFMINTVLSLMAFMIDNGSNQGSW